MMSSLDVLKIENGPGVDLALSLTVFTALSCGAVVAIVNCHLDGFFFE
jgi:hypothetical protein